MSKLPPGWKKVPLSYVCEVNPRDPGPAGHSAAVSFVPMQAVSDTEGVILSHDTRPFAEVAKGYTRFREQDVIFAKITPCMENGKSAVATGLHGGFACGSTEFHVLRPNEEILPSYLWRFVRQESFRKDAERHMTGAVGQRRVPTQYIKNVEIPLPPVQEQRRIVAKLDSLFKRSKRAREELARIPRLVERSQQAVLATAFRGELTAGWRAAHPKVEPVVSSLAAIRKLRSQDKNLSKRKRIASIPETELPDSWEWISPDEVASDARYSIAIGPFGSNLVRADYRESGVRLVFVRDIRRESFDENDGRFVTQEKANELHQHTVRGGDVLITKMGDPPGDTAIYPGDAEPAVITADCIKLTPHDSLALSTYLVLCIRSLIVRAQVSEITMGVAHQKVSLNRFRTIALPIPPLAEQKEIVRLVGAKIALLDNLMKHQDHSATLLDRLEQATLAKAFRGELASSDSEREIEGSQMTFRYTSWKGQQQVAK